MTIEIEIPDDATNINAMQALFPNLVVEGAYNGTTLCRIDDIQQQLDYIWCNTPYRKE